MIKVGLKLRDVVAIVTCLVVLVVFGSCNKSEKESITISNEKDLKQTAYADERTTGSGFTFTAKENWTATVKEAGPTKSSSVSWITLKINGQETYSGSAGTYTVVISIEINYTGEKREAVIEMACGGDKINISVVQDGVTQNGETPSSDPIELKSPITENTTLKALGLPVDYIYAGNGLLEVRGTATLTIEPGVTIQFTHPYITGGFRITSNATIKAVGTASKRIQFIGAKEAKGAWAGITIESNTDNQFAYCDFLNVGNSARPDYGGLQFMNAKVGVTHCKITNGLGTGIRLSSSELSAFNNNVIEGYADFPPMVLRGEYALKSVEKLDMTSDFTKNGKLYIEIDPYYTRSDITLNQTTVPYYFTDGPGSLSVLHNTMTINAGVTIYVRDGRDFNSGAGVNSGRLVINGTADKKVRFSRLPGSSLYWNRINFNGLKGSVINHCIFEYGGGGVGVGVGMLYINASTELTLNNVAINNSNSYGVYIRENGYQLTHNNVTFSNNRLGNVYDTRVNPPVILTHFP